MRQCAHLPLQCVGFLKGLLGQGLDVDLPIAVTPVTGCKFIACGFPVERLRRCDSAYLSRGSVSERVAPPVEAQLLPAMCTPSAFSHAEHRKITLERDYQPSFVARPFTTQCRTRHFLHPQGTLGHGRAARFSWCESS